jgi:ankyrin repeat protein
LLELGAKVDDTDRTRHTPLHFAAATGHTAVVNVLLQRGADVNARSTDGSTPLHYAALYGFVQIVQDLLLRGAEYALVRSPPPALLGAAPFPEVSDSPPRLPSHSMLQSPGRD